MSDEKTIEERQNLLKDLSSYRLAFEDTDFLSRAELRSYRLGLEYAKAQLMQREMQVESTIVVFGSARVPSPETAVEREREAEEALAANPDDPQARVEYERVRSRCAMVRHYQEARRFAALVAQSSQGRYPGEFVITTGGGPGIMEAANRGADEIGFKTMGLNIKIEHEQAPNPYITPELCFNFHYFAMRKMHLLLRAKAVVIFPGGFGTMDELFEALTLIQTGKMKRIPIVVFAKEYWSEVFNLQAMVSAGTINAADVDLIDWADTAEEAWEAIHRFYDGAGGEQTGAP